MASAPGWKQELEFEKPSTNVVSPSFVPHSSSLQSEDMTRSGTNVMTSGHSQTAVQIETNTVINEDEPPPPYTMHPSSQQNLNFQSYPANAFATTTPVGISLATPGFHNAGTRTTRKKSNFLFFIVGYIVFLCLFAIAAYAIINVILHKYMDSKSEEKLSEKLESELDKLHKALEANVKRPRAGLAMTTAPTLHLASMADIQQNLHRETEKHTLHDYTFFRKNYQTL